MTETSNGFSQPHTFKVAGYEVCMLSPVVARITIDVPWTRDHIPDIEEKAEVFRISEWIIRYLLGQDLIGGPGVGVLVMTNHITDP
jgi:hypothetical protein